MDGLSKLIDWIKLPINALVGLSIASGFIVFATEPTLANIALDSESLGDYVTLRNVLAGAAFVIFSSLTVATAGFWAARGIIGSVNGRKRVKRRHSRLRRLSRPEKEILKAYIAGQKRSLNFPMADGDAQGLVAARILYLPGPIGTAHSTAFNIQPWVWDFLHKNPQVLSDTDPVIILR